MACEAARLTTEKQGLAGLLLQSHERAFARPLIASAQPHRSKRLLCQELFACGFPVLAHGREQDPRLSYANAAALQLWDSHWDELIGMPSRLTAPDREQAERAAHWARPNASMQCRTIAAFASAAKDGDS